MQLNEQQIATVLAALRYYQMQGLGDPRLRPASIRDIADDGGELTSLDDADIDDLYEILNEAAAVVLKR